MRSISMAYPTIDLAATGAHIRQLRLEQGYSVQVRTPLCKISSTGEIEQRFRLN